MLFFFSLCILVCGSMFSVYAYTWFKFVWHEKFPKWNYEKQMALMYLCSTFFACKLNQSQTPLLAFFCFGRNKTIVNVFIHCCHLFAILLFRSLFAFIFGKSFFELFFFSLKASWKLNTSDVVILPGSFFFIALSCYFLANSSKFSVL